MRSWWERRRTKATGTDHDPVTEQVAAPEHDPVEAERAETPPATDRDVFRAGLSTTRQRLGWGRWRRRAWDQDDLQRLRDQLLQSDMGRTTTDALMAALERQGARDTDSVVAVLASTLKERLVPHVSMWMDTVRDHTPYVVLVTGINGAGKTTTLAKLAKRCQQAGLRPMVAAGDTYRAAAVEQLQQWGERLRVPVIAQPTGADPAAVAFDALTAAKAQGVDIVLVDTAGRLHTQQHLMASLEKTKRVCAKFDPSAPHHTLLVLDASIGQNSVTQAEAFHSAMGVDSVVMTKLDGSAKGGALVAVTEQLGLPISFLGLGEGADDLRPFDPETFVDALLGASTTP